MLGSGERLTVIRGTTREAAMSMTEDQGSHPGGMAVQQAPGLTRTDLQRQDLSVPGPPLTLSE
jgi:hypothetical protein